MVTGREIKGTETCDHVETGWGAPLMTGKNRHDIAMFQKSQERRDIQTLPFRELELHLHVQL